MLVLAKEDTETSSGLIGSLLQLKELRLASEDLIKQVIPSAASKDDGECSSPGCFLGGLSDYHLLL